MFTLVKSGKQGWRSGESARFTPMWPGLDSRTRHRLWVEFVVGSRPCSEEFSPGSPVYLPGKNQHILDQGQLMENHFVEMSL